MKSHRYEDRRRLLSLEQLEHRRLLVADIVEISSLSAKLPLGSLTYQSEFFNRDMAIPGEMDRFRLSLDAHQALSVAVLPSAELQAQIELRNSSGVLRQVMGQAPGAPVLLLMEPIDQAGVHEIVVRGVGDSVGFYSFVTTLNGTFELESFLGISNNRRELAEDLDTQFQFFGTGHDSRAVVLGNELAVNSDTGAAGGDWYRLTLADGESVHFAVLSDGMDPPVVELWNATGRARIAASGQQGTIDRFVDGTTDGIPQAYFARVVARVAAPYSLVVSRNAVLDAEANESRVLAQQVAPAEAVYGHVVGRQADPLPAAIRPATLAATPIQVLQSFDGISFTGFVPPDATVAVGPAHVVAMVNSTLAIFDKQTGQPLFSQSLAGASGFFGAVGAANFVADPWVVFDPSSQRFFSIAIDLTANQSHVLLAVSKNASPRTGDDWYKHRIDFTHLPSPASSLGTGAHFPDYPKLGLNADAVFVSGNYFPIFSGSGVYAGITAFDKATLIAGLGPDKIYEEHFAGFSVFPLTQYDQDDRQFFVEADSNGGSVVRIHTISDLSSAPTRTISTLTVPRYQAPEDVPQLGQGRPADSIDARVMTGVYRHGSLWFAHAIVDPTGGDGETAARWYEVDVDQPYTLVQSGNVDPGPGLHAWMPAIAVDSQRNMGIGFSVGGPEHYFSAGFTGRRASDRLGSTILPVTVYADGQGTYENLDGFGRNRWGDYSGLAIDPSDGATFWAFNEFAAAQNVWDTRIAAFQIEPSFDDDWYQFAASPGDVLHLLTSTTADGLGLIDNGLDVGVGLFSPSGELVAEATGPGNGQIRVTVGATQGGIWHARVFGESGSQGEYRLRIEGATGADPPPSVASTNPQSGSVVAAFPDEYIVTFSEPVLESTVQAGDLMVGGSAAIGVTRIDPRTYQFVLDSDAAPRDGTPSVQLLAGTVRDLQGRDNVAFQGTFQLDTRGPVVTQTLWNGRPLVGSFEPGSLTIAAQFNEDLFEVGSALRGRYTPSRNDIRLIHLGTGETILSTATDYSPNTDIFSATYGSLLEGHYEWRLLSGNGAFEDRLGNDLDGEPLGAARDGTPSGNGDAGGDYVVRFQVDRTSSPLGPWERQEPLGGLVFVSPNNVGVLNDRQDVDRFTFTLEAGETWGAIVEPEQPDVRLAINGVAAVGPGMRVVLPATQTAVGGTRSIDITGDGVTGYRLKVIRNAEIEAQIGDSSDGRELPIQLAMSVGEGRRLALLGEATPEVLAAAVWGVQPASGRIVQVDPRNGQIVRSFPAPGQLDPAHRRIGLSIAEGGNSLVYLNADDDPSILYRLNPVSGTVLSRESLPSGTAYNGVSMYQPLREFVVFQQDFESGLGVNERRSGAFGLNDQNPVLNNGTIMMGHSGNYANDSYDFYEFRLDLTGLETATLQFDYRARIEDFFDGVNVQASRVSIRPPNDLIEPTSGLPYDFSSGRRRLGFRAYDGDGLLDQGTARFDLSDFVGGRVNVRIQFESDSSVVDAGFNLDNVLVTGTQDTTPVVFLSDFEHSIDQQLGFSGPISPHFAGGFGEIVEFGALAGDGHLRQFGLIQSIIVEYDPRQSDRAIRSFPAPAPDIEGLAFDGQRLYASTRGAQIYVLDAQSGSIETVLDIPSGPLYALGALAAATSHSPNAPADSIELMVNGGFETSDFTGWTATTNGRQQFLPWMVRDDTFNFIGDSVPLEGKYSAMNGFDGEAGLEYELYQSVVIPNARTATLTTHHRIQFDSRGLPSTQDRLFEITVRDVTHQILETLWSETVHLDGSSYTDLGWQTLTFDLSEYVGQTVRIHFRELIPETRTGLALIQLDDISLTTSQRPLVFPDTDEYEIQLDGGAQHPIDVLLSVDPAEYPFTPHLELLDTDGRTVRSSASRRPLGASLPGSQVGMLGITVDASGTYTLRVTSFGSGDYALVVTDTLLLDAEPNDQQVDPLRAIKRQLSGIGYLASAAEPRPAAESNRSPVREHRDDVTSLQSSAWVSVVTPSRAKPQSSGALAARTSLSAQKGQASTQHDERWLATSLWPGGLLPTTTAWPDWVPDAMRSTVDVAHADFLGAREGTDVQSEVEPNDVPSSSNAVPLGFGPGKQVAIDAVGTLTAGRAPTVFQTRENDGAIPLATDARLNPRQAVRAAGVIGDGPFGNTTGDYDWYRIRNVAIGERITVDINAQSISSALDSVVGIFDGQGNLLAANDDDFSLDSFLEYFATTAGDHYVVVCGFQFFLGADAFQDDPFDSGSGPGVGSTGNYEVILGRDYGDTDLFRVTLAAGDILGLNVSGAARSLVLRNSQGEELVGSRQDVTFIHPAVSPLPGGGNAALSWVVDTAGDYLVGVYGGEGAYTLNLRVFRPVLEQEVVGTVPVLFLDFDGAALNTEIFRGYGLARLSPLVEFLPAWGLNPATDLDRVIDAIVATVEENLIDDIRLQGSNGDFASSRIPGHFGLQILNSRDHADPFGLENVSRVIVGGRINELGVPTLGIAESIDVGNFDTSETAVVLLDLLSAPANDPNSLNQFALDPSIAKSDLVGVGVGNIVSHEAGHLFANYHTDRLNSRLDLMDQGGNLANFVGLVGAVWGDGDEMDVDFVADRFAPSERFTGTENTRDAIAHGLATGRLDPSLVGPTVVHINPPAGENEDLRITRLQVQFSEALNAQAAGQPGAFRLIGAGSNGRFDNGGDDDSVIPLRVEFSSDRTSVTLHINSAESPLRLDRYRLEVNHEFVIDSMGNPLNSRTGTAGGQDVQHEFQVVYRLPSEADLYTIELVAGATVSLQTRLLLAGTLGPQLNTLNPALTLLDSSGRPVAADLDSLDGINARLNYRATARGHFTIVVSAESGVGEYLLDAAIQLPPASIVDRRIFYNNSQFDGRDADANQADDHAIAPSPDELAAAGKDPALGKLALLPGQRASFQNYTSFGAPRDASSRGVGGGINGIMIDVLNLANPFNLGPDDFQFRVGNHSLANFWDAAPTPRQIQVRPGEGQDGSDRITIIWPDYAADASGRPLRGIGNQWLQIVVLSTPDTGLVSPDVHYWGNAIGETGDSTWNARVTATDELLARLHPHDAAQPAPIEDFADFNRDGRVDALDQKIARDHRTHLFSDLNLVRPHYHHFRVTPTKSGHPIEAVEKVSQAPAAQLAAAASSADLPRLSDAQIDALLASGWLPVRKKNDWEFTY